MIMVLFVPEDGEKRMQLLIISDIHANLAALEQVLEDAQGEFDKIWCLGDLVGYGPNPNECVERVRDYDLLCLSGNHDWAVLGKLDINDFNREARQAIRWTQKTITEETRSFLDGLPVMLEQPPFTLAHASPRQPIWEYVLDPATAAVNFAHFATPYCLVGHSHTPLVFEHIDDMRAQAYMPVYGQPLPLGPGRYILNPGSVGQPRDSDPRAAYALLDLETMVWEFRRVAYPVAETQAQMRQIDMPYRLISRLQYGW